MNSSYMSHIMTCVFIIVASTEAKRLLNKEKLSMRPVLGGFMLGIILFAIGTLNESLGKGMALIAVVSSLVTVVSQKDKASGVSLADLLTPKTLK